jgi:hypothetical protein
MRYAVCSVRCWAVGEKGREGGRRTLDGWVDAQLVRRRWGARVG